MRVSDRRYHVPTSAPAGRIQMRARRKVDARKRMKPKSWPSAFWFASDLFARGNATRRLRFMELAPHLFTTPPPCGLAPASSEGKG